MGCSFTGTRTLTVRRMGRSLYTSTYFRPTSDDGDADEEESAATSASAPVDGVEAEEAWKRSSVLSSSQLPSSLRIRAISANKSYSLMKELRICM